MHIYTYIYIHAIAYRVTILNTYNKLLSSLRLKGHIFETMR